MNYWAKIGLFAGATGLLLGLWYWDGVQSTKKQEQEKTEAKVFNIDKDKIRKLVLATDESSVALQRDSSSADWKFVAPEKATKVNQNAASNVANTIADMSFSVDLPDTEKIVVGPDAEKKPYGLDKPKLQVEVTLEDKTVRAVKIGGDVNIGSKTGNKLDAVSAFATSSIHKNILILSTNSYASLKKTYADFRTKNPTDFKVADIKSFVITEGTNSKIRAVKGEKEWTLTSPRELLADTNGITNFLTTITGLEATKVIEKDALTPQSLQDYGLATPMATLEFYGANDKLVQKLDVGKAKDSLYISMADGSVGVLNLNREKDVMPELKSFRDRRVVRDLVMSEVTRIRTRSGKLYTKEGNSWYPTETNVAGMIPTPPSIPTVKSAAAPSPTPASKVANSDAANLFSDWEFMNADNIIDNVSPADFPTYGFDKPTQEFWFEFADAKKKPEHFIVGKKLSSDSKLIYVKRESRDAVYIVEESWLDRLNKIDNASNLAHK